MGDNIRVAIVDDQELMRTGLRMILESDAKIDVVGEAADGMAAILVCEACHPDVVLMDIRMPELDGIAATEAISRYAQVVMLTTFGDREYLSAALAAGAVGFILKDASATEIIDAVKATVGGGSVFSPSVGREMVEIYADVQQRGTYHHDDRVDRLSEKEREVLCWVARGLSNAEIASAIYVSEATVKTHVSHCLEKLQLRDRTQLAVFAHRSGLAK